MGGDLMCRLAHFLRLPLDFPVWAATWAMWSQRFSDMVGLAAVKESLSPAECCSEEHAVSVGQCGFEAITPLAANSVSCALDILSRPPSTSALCSPSAAAW